MTSTRKKASNRRLAGAVTIAKGLFAILTILTVGAFVSLATWPPINDVETGITPEYPALQPRAYRFTSDRVLSAAEESVDALERFTVVSLNEESRLVVATADTRSGRFTDDVTIRVEANGDGGAIVFIRSRSRVGRGDFGQNSRNIEAIQQEMDHNLGIE
jgi:uncharacterized protein (DUF1499 family)